MFERWNDSGESLQGAMTVDRPKEKDINGDAIVMGPWYWAQDRTGKILGAGQFAVPIGSTTILFYFNLLGYSTDAFVYAPAENPGPKFGVSRVTNPRMVQRFIVLLRDMPEQQIWLAYDDAGRIVNATYAMAFRWHSEKMARMALKRQSHNWLDAEIFSTLVEE